MKKFLITLSYLSLFGGVFYVYGIAGTSELDFRSTVIHSLLGLVFIGIGYIGLKVNKCEAFDD